MAKKRSRKKTKRTPIFKLSAALKVDIAGIVLVAISLLTLFSLISWNRGTVTGWWIDLLREGFGIGGYLAPVGLGVIGFWLILIDFEEKTEFDWEKPAGWLLLFLLFLTTSHLIASIGQDSLETARAGQGGGYIGHGLSIGLTRSVGTVGAWIVLVALFVVGLILLLDITLVRFSQLLAAHLRDALRWLQRRTFSRRRRLWKPPVAPPTFVDKEPITYPQRTLPERPAPAPEPMMQEAPDPEPARQPVQPRGMVSGVPERFTAPPEQAPRSDGPRVVLAPQEWQLPAIQDILEDTVEAELSQSEVRERVSVIEDTLASFGVPARVIEVNQGPAVTQFGVEPGFIEKKDAKGRVKRSKVKVSRISALSKDLALALAASPIRIEAPVPGRPIVGIEVPNSRTSVVSLRGVMEDESFQQMKSPLKLGLGRDVSGHPISVDLARMPHLLIAGATGSGKSVCINAIVACLLCNNTPQTLRLLMIDPKRVELIPYNGIPHLLSPVVVDLKRVVGALQWATGEMDRRYQLFAKAGVRNLDGYNQNQIKRGEPPLPIMVIVIDELADLMMVAPDEVERSICRIAQMARATGIHLVIATQRPSVDVVTGLIKANFPARIAFAVTSQVDSRVILDVAGAEQLLGQGDMLYMSPESSKLQRLQGCFLSDQEVHRLVRYWKGIRTAQPEETQEELVQPPLWSEMAAQQKQTKSRDDLFDEAVGIIQSYDRASISLLQRRLRIGYSRAARLVDMLEEEGYVGPEEGGNRSRPILRRNAGPINPSHSPGQ
jgi:DNA segregation ATPase FtsK/SpoIIIE, S-DNA-T family